MAGSFDNRKVKPSNYNFGELIAALPELEGYVFTNEYNSTTINFSDPAAVKVLNKALLKHLYRIENWDIPQGYLSPPVPGRAQYIHRIAELINDTGKESIRVNRESIPEGKDICIVDIGVGANCIYPLIGASLYGWSFIGSDTDKYAIDSARKNVEGNPSLQGLIELRLQKNSNLYLSGVIKKGEQIAATMCNPPFHNSSATAEREAVRKINNLRERDNKGRVSKREMVLNFAGKSSELCSPGGEIQFIRGMVFESREFASQCRWFTSLVSKKESLPGVYNALDKAEAVRVITLPLEKGNKTGRVVAWHF
jgi:23S rRNA (adenine1618-N6)-methyltransferase